MDVKTLHTVLREEKARLGITLPHKVKSYQGTVPVEGTVLLHTDDVFQLTVLRGKITLLYHQEKLPAISDADGRLIVRHELCHVLDLLEEKIGHTSPGIRPATEHLLEGELINAVISETMRSFYEFTMARRYIRLFGLEEFKAQNEIGMEEFLTLTRNLVNELGPSANKLASYVLFSVAFGIFKEAIKVSFYQPRDPRFPGGIWDLVEWLIQDFDYLDTLEIAWRDKSSILCCITLAIFENFDIASALEPAVKRHKGHFTCKLYPTISKMTPPALSLLERWVQRFNFPSITQP